MINLNNFSEFDELNTTVVHIDTNDNREEIKKFIATCIDGEYDKLGGVHNNILNIDITKNDYYDREKIDPTDLDTYTYFPYRIELGPKDEGVGKESFVESVRELLEKLKSGGFRPALSAYFEDEIPGY
ncbi:hypothetical protein KKA94_03190 [Patescibacteria group bacterium]|nr:hypothetical protein [Patescibacteria group bacterium]